MLLLETKQSGSKILTKLGSPRGGVFLEEASESDKEKEHFIRNVER
jgi:hypothetical protein